MSTRSTLACLLLMTIVHPLARAKDEPVHSVWVVTDSRHPVEGRADDRLIKLDAPAQLSADIATNLPRDPQQAAAIMRERLNARSSEIQQKFATAYQGVIDAWSLGVTKVPAMIVDRKYVVYGETDIDRALAKINSYRSAKK